MEKNYFGAIEFGSLFTNVVIVSYNIGKIDVVANCKLRSHGFYNGYVINQEEFESSIEQVKNEIFNKFKIKLNEVIVVLPNNAHKIYSATVDNKVLTERQIIGKNQVDAIRSQIKKAKVNDEEILVEEVPTYYVLDGDRYLRTAPVNYQSSMLKIHSNIHTLPKEVVMPIKNSLQNKGIKILEHYLNCSCSANATSTNYELENECISINIGQEVTTICGYNKLLLLKSTYINFGVHTLIKYLAKDLGVSEDYATELFESYFVCDINIASDVIFNRELNLSEKRISAIVLNRLYLAFDEIVNACNNFVKDLAFPTNHFYLVSGWLNDFECFIDEFSKHTNLNVKYGNIDVVGLNSQAYANCYGALVMFVNDNLDLIQHRIESKDDIENENANSNLSVSEDNKSSESTSRFKDIFDE